MVKNGITLLSARDPVERCRKVANAVPLSDRTLYFCPSPIYGYGLDVLLSRLQSNAPNSAVLCVEADPELCFYEGTEGTKGICFTNITDPNKLCEFVRENWGPRVFRRIEMVKLTGGWQLYPDLYSLLCETLANEITNEWSNALTLAKLGRLYIKNFIRNLSLIPHCKSLSELSFGNSPVLVLGAGPSLDEALDNYSPRFDLSDVKNRSIKIICVDTCLGALKDRGITPDLTVILESQHWNMRDFAGCRNWKVPAAFDMSAYPASAKVLAGEVCLFFTPWTRLSIFDRMKNANLLPEAVPPLGSVGLAAMEIARRLTTGKIIHAGLDFYFTMDLSHARGTPNPREKLFAHNRFKSLLNTGVFKEGVIREGERYTNPIMKRYKDLFEKEYSKFFSHGGHRSTEIMEKNLSVFIQSEIDRLLELRDILTGKNNCPLHAARCTLKECDYLYFHFPDYSGGVEPNSEDKSFLNRVRVEIDFMLRLWETVNI